VETATYDDWLETVAANRGIACAPTPRCAATAIPAVRFIPLVNAPASPVSLAFRPRDQHALIRRFVEAALEAVAPDR
jgi:hypothetical protein